jgi:arginine/lysine/histidine/glutamine transport system ATP-binding protein
LLQSVKTPISSDVGTSALPSVVSCKSITKRFGANQVLKGVTLDIRQGEVVSIIGPSGCGKSTFLRCLNGLEVFDGGSLTILGIDLAAAKGDWRLWRRVRTRVGMVFQHFNLFPHLTVMENLEIAPRKVLGLPVEVCRARAEEHLAQVGLAAKASAYPSQLSGGQKQRVAIARGLCMRPDVLLFDEPTSALDPELVEEVMAALRMIANTGITMLVVTHEMKFARDASDRVVFFKEGIVEEQGPPADLFGTPRSPALQAFLGRS